MAAARAGPAPSATTRRWGPSRRRRRAAPRPRGPAPPTRRSGCPTPSGLSTSRSRSTDRALGVAPSMVVASSGASWPCVIIVRSPSSDTDTVTGRVPAGGSAATSTGRPAPAPRAPASRTRRSRRRRTPPPSAVRRPSRRAATARLAMPPGHDPIPSAQTSVPGLGSSCSPVKTMSRKTVPCTKTSNCGSPPSRTAASGSNVSRAARQPSCDRSRRVRRGWWP